MARGSLYCTNPNSHQDAKGGEEHPLRILYLEDDPADCDLVKRILNAAQLSCQFICVTNEAEFREALEKSAFEVILADYTLPGYDGVSALLLAREKHPEIPCLFVSGTIDDQQARNSLECGATDYVLKNHLERLPHAICRALREAEERSRRQKAENALRHSEQRFREIAETIHDVFWVVSPDMEKLLYVSPAYETVWGRPLAGLRASPKSWLEAIAPEDQETVLEALRQLAQGTDCRMVYRILRPDGLARWIEDRGYAVRNTAGIVERLIGIATDITERRHLETQLLHVQKMEAVGQLAGGIAHDFNNLLTVITGRTNLLLETEELSPDVRESLNQIYTAGEHAANLTRQLLVFSRKKQARIRTLDLNDIIDDVMRMLRRLIGEHICLELVLAPRLPCIQADAGMIEQVLMNLALNARDAMPKGGRLVIKTEERLISEPDTHSNPEARPGRYSCLSIQDSGEGIPPEVLPHIFEPFYTTKEVGKGTGLGLATVFGIVQEHNGWIEVGSFPGTGTTFQIFLPAASGKAATQEPAATASQVVKGKELVLLVEDDVAVREFTVAILQKYGYRVLQAASGTDALEVWKWHAPRIELLVTDLVMPGNLNGLDLAEILRAEKPALRVICTSGYSRSMEEESARDHPGIRFLRKPYQPKELTALVRELLDQPSG